LNPEDIHQLLLPGSCFYQQLPTQDYGYGSAAAIGRSGEWVKGIAQNVEREWAEELAGK